MNFLQRELDAFDVLIGILIIVPLILKDVQVRFIGLFSVLAVIVPVSVFYCFPQFRKNLNRRTYFVTMLAVAIITYLIYHK